MPVGQRQQGDIGLRRNLRKIDAPQFRRKRQRARAYLPVRPRRQRVRNIQTKRPRDPQAPERLKLCDILCDISRKARRRALPRQTPDAFLPAATPSKGS